MNKYLLILSAVGLMFFAACSSEKKPEPETSDSQTEETMDAPAQEEEIMQADSADMTDEVVAGEEVKDDSKEEKPAVKSAAGDYSKDPLKGYIVSIKDVAFGAEGRISKDQAKQLVSEGKTIGFRSGNNVYIVYHENGSYAGEKILNFANRTTVGLLGKAVSKNGMNAFIMTRIVSLD